MEIITDTDFIPKDSFSQLANLAQMILWILTNKGKCKNSAYAAGWHRVGAIRAESLLDGAIPGDSLKEICLDCGKRFEKSIGWFLPLKQPSKLGIKC